MARIFLSYAHEDQAAAKRIVDALAREGLDAWWDHEIPPGRTWDEVIGSRIKDARVALVIWSRRSVASDFVKEEAQIALEAGKLLPVRVDDIEPPVGFRRTQAANLIGWRGEANHPQWRMVLDEIRARLGGARSTRPMQRQSSYSGGGGSPAMGLIAIVFLLAALGGGAWFAFERGRIRLEDAQTEAAEAPADAATADPNANSRLDPREVELEYWRACCSGANTTQTDYRGYLARYPDGEFAAVAQQRLRAAPARQQTATQAPSPAPQAASIVGAWRGQISRPGMSLYGFRFNTDGSADPQLAPNGQFMGPPHFWHWRQEGEVVTLTMESQQSGPAGAVLSGRVTATEWSGTYTRDGESQSYPFRYTRQ